VRNALGQVQSVLVLGGGSEIAQAIVGRLIDDGCSTVLLAARHPEALTSDVESMRVRGATTVEVVPFDALQSADHVALIDDLFGRFDDIDVAVLAFGVLGDQAAFDADPAAAAEAATANYVGAVSSGLAVANRMRAQGHGTIVVLSSVAGERVRKANFVYGSSKAGLDSFAQGLGDSLAGSGVRVTVVRPGFVHSKMTTGMAPAPLATTPDAVAQAVVKGIAANREVIWVPGQLRLVMAAFRHLPRSVWRKVSARAS
jgi:decaprenylphospho-beta-D-erythro-pentofuranosid-2-ulose 2-reductase